ncbi:hypothetical protein [Rhodanobacter lindaniclasticus]
MSAAVIAGDVRGRRTGDTERPFDWNDTMTSRVILAALLAALALPALARADAVSDLRAALGKLQPTQPLAASLRVSTTVHKDDGKTDRAQLQVGVRSGSDGLGLRFSPELLQRAAAEAAVNAKDKDAPTPIQDLLGQLSPVNVQPMVDYAPVLLRQLDGATLASQRDDTREGKPAHVLVFDVPLPPSANKEMSVKKYTGQLSVWLGSDGVPLAVRNVMAIKGRKLLISIEFGSTTEYALRQVGTRLLAVSRHTEETHSVFGHDGSSVTEAVLTLAPAASGG